jgi:hypothetical protein
LALIAELEGAQLIVNEPELADGFLAQDTAVEDEAEQIVPGAVG